MPLVLRLIVLRRGEQEVYLLTNVLDPKRLSDEDAGVLYEMRWGIEVFQADYDEKDNLYRGGRWAYSNRACVAEAGPLVPAAQALRSRRRFMRSAKEGVVPPRAQNAAISVCC